MGDFDAAAMDYYKGSSRGSGGGGGGGNSKNNAVRKDIDNDEMRQRAMEAYKAKGKSATMAAAGGMKASGPTKAARGGRGGGSSSEESSLSSDSDPSDSSGGGDRGAKKKPQRARDPVSSDESDASPRAKSKGKKSAGFEDENYGSEGAALSKKMRKRGKIWMVLDKICPCCSVAKKYKQGTDKADPKFKLYEGVDNTLEPILRLLSLFTMGVPSTESSIPLAHLLPLALSSLLCLGGSVLYASDWTSEPTYYPLNAASFGAIFLLNFVFLSQGSRYFRSRAMSTLCQEMEGRSWNWTRQLPVLMKLVNVHSAVFLLLLTAGFAVTLLGYFVISGHSPVDGKIVFYVSRILFGFYMNGVLFCMPILFSLEMHLIAARVQGFTVAIGKFPNLDSAIEEHIEIWKCIDRVSKYWTPAVMASLLFAGATFVLNIHYLLERQSHYFLQNMVVPASAAFIMVASAARVTERCRYTAVHLSGYRSSADIFLAPLERIDFLTYLHANDAGLRIMGVLVTSQGAQRLIGAYLVIVGYLFTLQLAVKEVVVTAGV
jgi:hypothetical protein